MSLNIWSWGTKTTCTNEKITFLQNLPSAWLLLKELLSRKLRGCRPGGRREGGQLSPSYVCCDPFPLQLRLTWPALDGPHHTGMSASPSVSNSQRHQSLHLTGALKLRQQSFTVTHLLACSLQLPKVFLGSLSLDWEFGLGIVWMSPDNDYTALQWLG